MAALRSEDEASPAYFTALEKRQRTKTIRRARCQAHLALPRASNLSRVHAQRAVPINATRRAAIIVYKFRVHAGISLSLFIYMYTKDTRDLYPREREGRRSGERKRGQPTDKKLIPHLSSGRVLLRGNFNLKISCKDI